MQYNSFVSLTPKITWDGTASFGHDIRGHVNFSFAFEIRTTLAADTIFKFQAAPVSEDDPCAAGAYEDVEAIPTCAEGVADGEIAQITLPAGTEPQVCSVTIPCRAGAFVRVAAVSGSTADVNAIIGLCGPRA